jgi:ketosteroid isomerase-like protein
MVTDARGVVNTLVAAVNAHDLDALFDCFAADFINETPVHPSRSFTGAEQVQRNWAAILAGVPDLRAEVVADAVSGASVWTEWRMDGHRRDGVEFHMRGVVIFTVTDDVIRSARFYLEPLDSSGTEVSSAVARSVGARDAEARS